MPNSYPHRLHQAKQWLAAIGYPTQLNKLAGDASQRRYWRLHASDDRPLLLMDAPPTLESSQLFVDITTRLQQTSPATFKVPDIIAHEENLGFLLLEDFGNNVLNDAYATTDADALITLAIEALLEMQQRVSCLSLASYNQQQCLSELNLFSDWFLGKHCQTLLNNQTLQALQSCYTELYANFKQQPQCFVHRDYHCRNLFHLTDPITAIAMIDYQNAVYGPQYYDLVSLLKDAYYELSEERRNHHLKIYWQNSPIHQDWSEFLETVDLTGLQRHLKILGIFCRLHYRDHKNHYLTYLPLVKKYILNVCQQYQQKRPRLNIITQLLT